MTEVLMVRHGQSVWNAQGRWQGQADPPLSALGRAQAAAAGVHLGEWPSFDAVASSALDRAATTASIIADQLGLGEPIRSADLNERDVGEWSGLTRDEVDRRFPGYLRRGLRPAGYEPDADFLARIKRGLATVRQQAEGRVLIVAHGGVVYCLEQAVGKRFEHLPNLGAVQLGVHGPAHAPECEMGDRHDLLVDFDGDATAPTAL